MLEKPALPDERIMTRLREAYGLEIAQVEFLPLGADVNTAVYRVVTRESVPYFLKLRKSNFEETSVLVPQLLHARGIRQIIPILQTTDGPYWTSLDAYTCILYPFIEGRSGFEVTLSDHQWLEFGVALKSVHMAVLPPDLQARIPVETYTAHWREMVERFQTEVEHTVYDDPIAAKMAAFMCDQRDVIRYLVERAGQLACDLQAQPQEKVLCHSDIHAGNLLLTADDALYIVDWDNPILALKERDLMFIGSGLGSMWNTDRENGLFYQGYGPTEINLTALAYYRFERIVQDFAAFGEALLATDEGGADREQSFRYFSGQFEPGEVIDLAYQTDRRLKEG